MVFLVPFVTFVSQTRVSSGVLACSHTDWRRAVDEQPVSERARLGLNHAWCVGLHAQAHFPAASTSDLLLQTVTKVCSARVFETLGLSTVSSAGSLCTTVVPQHFISSKKEMYIK